MEFLKTFTLVTFSVMLLACGAEEDETTPEGKLIKSSSIQVKPPYIENKSLISLVSPVNGENVTNTSEANIELTFRLDDATQAAVILFNQRPYIVDGVVTSFSDICLGGTFLSSVKTGINDNTLILGNQSNHDKLYACGADQIEFLNLSKELTVDENLLQPGMTVYWMVMGYDDTFLVTHSSPLSKFEIGL